MIFIIESLCQFNSAIVNIFFVRLEVGRLSYRRKFNYTKGNTL